MYLGIAFATIWELVNMATLLIYVSFVYLFGIVTISEVYNELVC